MTSLGFGLLETIILSSKTASTISSIGTNLIIGTINTTTKSIGSILKYLISTDSMEIIHQLADTDLDFTVSIIQQLVLEQENKQLTESIRKALIGLNQILILINNELDIIKKQMDYHKTKFFSSWRSFNCEINIEIVKKHTHILKNRYNILVDLLKIYGTI